MGSVGPGLALPQTPSFGAPERQASPERGGEDHRQPGGGGAGLCSNAGLGAGRAYAGSSTQGRDKENHAQGDQVGHHFPPGHSCQWPMSDTQAPESQSWARGGGVGMAQGQHQAWVLGPLWGPSSGQLRGGRDEGPEQNMDQREEQGGNGDSPVPKTEQQKPD